MRVALVSQPFDIVAPPVQNSIGIWTYEIARRLAHFCDVIVYTRRDPDWQKEVEDHEGVRYRLISTSSDPLEQIFNHNRSSGSGDAIRPFFASRHYCSEYFLQVAKDVRAQRCNIVHIHDFSQFVPVIRRFNPGAKTVLHMHCEWLTQLDRAIIEPRLRGTDLIIGCSEYITEKIRRHFPQFAARCRTVFNGVDVNHFASINDHSAEENGANRLLFVGRITPEKGLHVLLDAFQRVIERFPHEQLEIVGPKGQTPLEFIVTLCDDDMVSELASFYDGRGYLSHLQDRLLSLNIASHVTFSGFVPYAKLINHYRDAEVLINPSLSESFGMSLIEAMACEVPVVATRVGGMTGIVEDGKTGILVEPGNAPVLTQAILHLLSDAGLRKSMGKAARQRVVELFSWEQVVENLLCQYKSINQGNE